VRSLYAAGLLDVRSDSGHSSLRWSLSWGIGEGTSPGANIFPRSIWDNYLRQPARHEYPPPLVVVSLIGAGGMVGSSRMASATATFGYSDIHHWRGLSANVGPAMA
jgi:hypothetical protein